MSVTATVIVTVRVLLIWTWTWTASATETANRSVGGGLGAMERLRIAEASAMPTGDGCGMAIATVPLSGAEVGESRCPAVGVLLQSDHQVLSFAKLRHEIRSYLIGGLMRGHVTASLRCFKVITGHLQLYLVLAALNGRGSITFFEII